MGRGTVTLERKKKRTVGNWTPASVTRLGEVSFGVFVTLLDLFAFESCMSPLVSWSNFGGSRVFRTTDIHISIMSSVWITIEFRRH